MDLQDLFAVEAIKTLKARYWRYIDTKDWASWRQLFSPDMRFVFPELGAERTVAEHDPWQAAFLKDAVSIHRGYNPDIELLSATSAKAIWPFEDRIYWTRDRPGPGGLLTIHGDGYYHDTYVAIGGEWKIQSTMVKRLRFDAHSVEVSLP